MKIKFHILNLIIIVFFLSCEKEEKETATSYVILSQELSENYRFNTDSYWVYSNSSGDQDSVGVTSLKYEVFDQFQSGSVINILWKHETIKMSLNSTASGEYNFFLYRNMLKLNGGDPTIHEPSGQPIYFEPNDLVSEIGGITFVELLDSLLIGDHYFYDVKQFNLIEENQIDPQFDADIDFYYSPGIGLIKKEIFGDNPEVWELQSWEIQ